MAKKNKSFRNRSGIVYSTNQEFNYSYEGQNTEQTPDTALQDLRVMLDRKQRGGKQVTLVTGFRGSERDLKELGKLLKSKCGTGGTAKDGEILVQGNWVEKIHQILIKEGYKAKISGGF